MLLAPPPLLLACPGAAQSLPSASKALLLHLLLRKRSWLQLSSLRYQDVPEPGAAAQQLSAAGLLRWLADGPADVSSVVTDMPVEVLKRVLADVLPKNHPARVTAASAASAGNPMTFKSTLVSSLQVTSKARRGACSAWLLTWLLQRVAARLHCHFAMQRWQRPWQPCPFAHAVRLTRHALLQAVGNRTKLQAALQKAAGPCLRVVAHAATTFERLQRLYFISPGQDLQL